ncbi:sensor box histidine kinase (plasmid) [Natronomonas pharaonis DSM 2160]|uniref:Sensor box histidine kinase n=1 Tax=Natronomonas pharaonis (strain ATCC 35678 / DSM 2160 / CIP 103997 / JCM 8858 / NBRC 14720 / NCIMB 2260 / Gabara) TaxID=348780 RepID=Q3IM51_NATPD|nr:PAS domain-containing protein [Natronomonas pharaonis]CAI50812.1 sensor box histidine kinase [Natronomonas pharaonis DSM 2160]
MDPVRSVRCDGGRRPPDNRPEPLVIHSDNQIVSVNDAALVLFGADSEDDILGRSLQAFVVSDNSGAVGRTFDQLLADDTQVFGLAVSIESLDGDIRDAIALNSAIDWDGTQAVQTMLLDVTADGGGALTTFWEEAMHEAPVGISIADARKDDLPITYVNNRFVEITGYARAEVLGRNCRFLQGEATRDEPIAQLRAAIERGETATVELRNYRKDGTMFWNRVTVSPLKNHNGEVTHYIGFQEDISEAKSFERESTLLESQVAATNEATFITDSDGTIQYVNQAFEELTGYTAEEAVGRDPSLLNAGRQDETFYEKLWETITAGDVWQETLWNQTKTGEYYQADQTIVPVTNDQGEIRNFVAIQTEITRDEIREQVLQVLDRVLRHNISHTVMKISGFASELEADLDAQEGREAVEQIQSAATDLESISERIRPVVELFHGAYEDTPWTKDRLAMAIGAAQEAYPDADIVVDNRMSADELIANGEAVSIALMEAIENAVKHSDQASPTVEITLRSDKNPPRLYLSIADDGPGAPTEAWDIVQSGVETQLSHTTGIGLWIVYWTIAAVGGNVTMTDNDPRGAVVEMEIPLETTTASVD